MFARSRARVAVVGVVLYAWWATGLDPFSWAATLAVVGAGAAVMAVSRAFRPLRARLPTLARRTPVVWLALASVLAGWQLAAWFQQPRTDHPTLSSITDSVLDTHGATAVAFLAWLAGARWLARR